jgi:hypothetical protein
MFTPEQYRAKAIEYCKLVGTASGAGELGEFERLERSFAELANNTQSVTEPRDQMMRTTAHAAGPSSPRREINNASANQRAPEAKSFSSLRLC